jgi:hypothetical protein
VRPRAELEVPALAADEFVRDRGSPVASPGVLPNGVFQAAGLEIPLRDAVVDRLELAPEWDSSVVVGTVKAADAGAFVCAVDVGVDGPGVEGQGAGLRFELMRQLPLDGPDEEEGEDLCSEFGR